jgi:antitoxin component YwqK of YwqJK toxin-antitoxin module
LSSFWKISYIICLCCVVASSPSWSQAISSEMLTTRNGVAYTKIDNEPYEGDVLNFYSNGQLNYKGGYKTGLKEGIWVGYYYDGQLKYRGRYKNGKRNGRWDTKTKYGQIKKWHSGLFKNDTRISD